MVNRYKNKISADFFTTIDYNRSLKFSRITDMQPTTSFVLPFWSFLLALGVAFVWGLNFVMVKIGLAQIPPLTFCALRFLFASIPAIFLLPKPKAQWKYIIGYGLMTFALQFSLLFAGLAAGVSAGVGALILQSQVFFAIFFACLFMKQTLAGWHILGSIVSFAGVSLIALHGNIDCSMLGFGLLLASAISWGLGNCISVNLKNENMLSLVVWGSFVAFFPLAIIAFWIEKPLPLFSQFSTLTFSTLGALLYVTYASTYFGYGVWSWLLSRHPTASITPFALLCPIVAMCASSYWLLETFDLWKINAAVLVIVGLVINTLGQSLYARFVYFARSQRDGFLTR
jgi:O-acetylserine/cysteine efflux transporter